MKKVEILSISCLVLLISYTVIGTAENVDEIKAKAPYEIEDRGWELLRYEGFQYGSWYKHGGYAWYHVRNTDNHSIQYRVKVSMWNGELQYWYGKPEVLNRMDIKYNSK